MSFDHFPTRNAAGYFTDYQSHRHHKHNLGADESHGLRIVDNFGTPLPSDATKRAFPVPEQIANRTVGEFGVMARMGYRSASVHKIATDIVKERLDLESLNNPGIPSDELYKFPLTLPGIGPYAASCLMIYLGRYNRVNVDSWARTLVGKELGRKVTDKEVHAFFEHWFISFIGGGMTSSRSKTSRTAVPILAF